MTTAAPRTPGAAAFIGRARAVTGNQSPARLRFLWLDAVATDARLPPLATRVAVVLGRWLNSDGLAWPSVATVAASLGATDRAVQKVLAALVEAGHIAVERRRGRGNTNLITIIAPTVKGERSDAFSGEEKVNSETRKGEQLSQKRRTSVHPNNMRNQGDPSGLPLEPEDRRDAHAPKGAALGDLTRPDTGHREIEAALAAGDLTPAEADFLRRSRSYADV